MTVLTVFLENWKYVFGKSDRRGSIGRCGGRRNRQSGKNQARHRRRLLKPDSVGFPNTVKLYILSSTHDFFGG